MIGGSPECGDLAPPSTGRPGGRNRHSPNRRAPRAGQVPPSSRRPPAAALVPLALFLLLLLTPALAIERFPPPDFTGGHVVPETVVPASHARAAGWLDVAALALGLALASFISLKTRSRTAIVVLSLAALAYFGFWRRGCVCAIGSIQNVALGIADPGYAIPLAVIAFFTLPLVVALVWGRGFCAGVCPHGAIQDLVLVKPVKVPRWLDESLRVLPWVYLALAVLLAATGGTFIICKYDPFVGIFRMAGSRQLLLAGAGMLAISLVVGRPYCRYLCPYGALLGMVSQVAKFRPTVTPDTCIQCRLCESSCPFEALNPPTPEPTAPERRSSSRRRVALLAIAAPLAALVFAWIGGMTGLATIPFHPTGELAELVLLDDAGQLPQPPPDEILAFRQAGADRAALFTAAASLESRVVLLGRVIGALFGIIIVFRIARLLFPRPTPDYETAPANCVSCARCYSTCPYELIRRGIPVDLEEHRPQPQPETAPAAHPATGDKHHD